MKGKTYKYTDLFMLVPKLRKENIISEEEKVSIKEFVIKNKPDLSKIFEEYKRHNDKCKLANELKILTINKQIEKKNTFERRDRKVKGSVMIHRSAKFNIDNFGVIVDDSDFLGSPKICFEEKTNKKDLWNCIKEDADEEEDNK